jgi:hypothetical protein
MNWAEKYINTTHKNCWIFVRSVYKEELDILLPEFATIFVGNIKSIIQTMEIQSKLKTWGKIDDPHDFAIVAMSKSQYIHHVGVWTTEDRGKVLHAFEKKPVVANNYVQLKRMGFQRIEFYEFCENHYHI